MSTLLCDRLLDTVRRVEKGLPGDTINRTVANPTTPKELMTRAGISMQQPA